jgi:LCP family protein required for cell wall assembly
MAVLVCGSMLALLSGIALVGGKAAIARYTSNVQQDNLLGAAAVEGQALEGPVNLLLLGVDAPIHDGQSEDTRSDTIIVLHVPATHDQAYLISVPRDTWVDVPAFERSGYYGGQAKITEAFYHGSQNGAGWDGGSQLVALTLNQLTGLQFNGAAIVNFGGFQRIIEELGGVDFCVDTPATSEHLVLVNGAPMGVFKAAREGHYGEPVRYEVGCQQLAGWQALDYARQRKNLESGEGDYGRHRHTQQLLKAMAKKATSSGVLTSPATIDNVMRAAGNALILDTNDVQMVDFFLTLKGITANDMISLRTNQGDFHSTQIGDVSVETLSPESLQMFQAAANDTMAPFLLAHPDFANADAEG